MHIKGQGEQFVFHTRHENVVYKNTSIITSTMIGKFIN